MPINDVWEPITSKGDPAPLISGTLLGRARQPRRIPTATLSDEAVVFWWPNASPAPRDCSSLTELARAVASLGHASCFVTVEVIDHPPGTPATFVPRTDGHETLRIPTTGRFTTLRDAYSAGRRPTFSDWASYGAPDINSAVLQAQHRDLITLQLSADFAPLPLESAARVIATWRAAILSRSDQPRLEVISGHAVDSTPEEPKPTKRAHLALLPIADVGHRYARSHLLGLAAALPCGLSAEDRKACLRAIGRVGSLTLGDLGVWKLDRCDASETRSGLLTSTWCRSSLVWASVTPVVFGRYPKSLWSDEAVTMIRDACRIAGLPQPAEVGIAPVSWVLGVPPSYRFPALPSRPGKPRKAHAHVRLVFSEAVPGPVLVGAGRHQGYGLFRQIQEGDK